MKEWKVTHANDNNLADKLNDLASYAWEVFSIRSVGLTNRIVCFRERVTGRKPDNL